MAEAQPIHRTPFASVIKAAPTRIVLGMLDDPLPAAYANAGLCVTVRQTGWRSLDNKTFRVSAVEEGTAASAPRITLEGSDTTGEIDANIPRADAFVEIRRTVNNDRRYSWPPA